MGQGALEEGQEVPALHVRDLNGQSVTITYGEAEKPTILYVLAPSCRWCRANTASIAALAKQLGEKYRIIGLSLSSDGLADFVPENRIEFPVYAGLDPSAKSSYRFGGTPETVVVSPTGRVLRKWDGAYLSDNKEEIERFFGVRLPLASS
jgi:hypothetical protein